MSRFPAMVVPGGNGQTPKVIKVTGNDSRKILRLQTDLKRHGLSLGLYESYPAIKPQEYVLYGQVPAHLTPNDCQVVTRKIETGYQVSCQIYSSKEDAAATYNHVAAPATTVVKVPHSAMIPASAVANTAQFMTNVTSVLLDLSRPVGTNLKQLKTKIDGLPADFNSLPKNNAAIVALFPTWMKMCEYVSQNFAKYPLFCREYLKRQAIEVLLTLNNSPPPPPPPGGGLAVKMPKNPVNPNSSANWPAKTHNYNPAKKNNCRGLSSQIF